MPWELADIAPDARTLTLRYVVFVAILGRMPDPRRRLRLPLRQRRPVPLSKLHGVTKDEASDSVTLSVLVAARRPRRVREVAQAFPKEGLVRVRLREPLGGRELGHGPIDPEHEDDAEFLPLVRERREGYGP